MKNSGTKIWFLLTWIILVTSLAGTACRSQNKSSGYTSMKATRDGTGKVYMGREIAHVMGAGNASWLERNNRQQEENSNLAVSKMPLKEFSSVADIGAGSGYYSFRIAAKLATGKVYAVEIQDDLIALMEKRKEELKNKNVEIIKGDSISPNLPDNSIDLAIMVDVYHELLYPQEMLQNIRKALKKGGQLLLMEYKAEDPSIAIKELHKMSVKQVTKELAANGFTLAYRGDFLPIQHFLLYKKNN